MWIPFDPADVAQVFTTESRQKHERIFTLTHTSMNRILVSHNRVGLSNGQFVGEHAVLDLIQQSAPLDSNRVWFIVGETGSGKSELCQWLEYQLRERHLPLHISRRQANLTGILDVLHTHLPSGLQGQTTDLPQDVLTDHLRLHLMLRAHREGRGLGYVEQLLPFLPDLARRLYQPLASFELPPHLPPAPADVPFTAWLFSAVREVLGLQSLEPTLRALAEHTAQLGKRPVLLLEDITTLGFLRDDLLDYIFDLSAPGFDAVIGLTSGFEDTHLHRDGDLSEMAYVRDRLSARFQLSHKSGETFFLNQPQDLHDLVRRYLGCLPAQSGGSSPAFSGLYPFSPTMLDRLYTHLVESGNPRQTPRNLLDAVIKPSLCLNEPPHVTLFRAHPYLRTPSVTFYHQDIPPELQGLLYWHGEVRDGSVHVPDDVAQAFGYDSVPPVPCFPNPTGSTWLFGKTADDPTDLWKEAIRELQAWQSAGAPFPKRQYLKRGIERLLRALLDPRPIQHPRLNALSADPLEYTRGGDHLPIYLPESGDVRPEHWPSLHFPRTLPPQLLEECLTYAFSANRHVECFADLGHTRQVLEDVVSDFRSDVRDQIGRLTGQSWSRMVFGLWWLCQHVCQGHPLQMNGGDGKRALLQYDLAPKELRTAWSDERRHRVLHRTHQELRANRDHYRGLFVSLFHHRDDLMDPVLYEQECRQFDPSLFMDTLATLSLSRLSAAPYRQRGSKLSLTQLLQPAVEYAAALKAYVLQDEDRLQWTAVERSLEHAIQQADELDLACRRIERLAHQAGWTITAPPTSHTWRSGEWAGVLRQSQQASRDFKNHPPIVQITVARTWRERLEQIEPIQWMNAVKVFRDSAERIHQERHPVEQLPTRQTHHSSDVHLNDLEDLASTLAAAADAADTLPQHVAEQTARSIRRLQATQTQSIEAVLGRHGIHAPVQMARQSREASLVLLSDLLECMVDLMDCPP
ncbi:hypothetical protein [Deinococcus sp. LM3]|uniref:hypothetical protein n=1 Tax=Deinococcus sp. LM3 TaxID=1938608 RepID=UPI00117D28DB|nr:hypothetical protein [Deinococcus sp. LM3]